MLADHGAILERWLRHRDGSIDAHVVRFPSAAAFATSRHDPLRVAQHGVLAASGAEPALHELHDV